MAGLFAGVDRFLVLIHRICGDLHRPIHSSDDSGVYPAAPACRSRRAVALSFSDLLVRLYHKILQQQHELVGLVTHCPSAAGEPGRL
ncbi:hypothetical protein D3C81_1993670 [compost metagenome]